MRSGVIAPLEELPTASVEPTVMQEVVDVEVQLTLLRRFGMVVDAFWIVREDQVDPFQFSATVCSTCDELGAPERQEVWQNAALPAAYSEPSMPTAAQNPAPMQLMLRMSVSTVEEGERMDPIDQDVPFHVRESACQALVPR